MLAKLSEPTRRLVLISAGLLAFGFLLGTLAWGVGTFRLLDEIAIRTPQPTRLISDDALDRAYYQPALQSYQNKRYQEAITPLETIVNTYGRSDFKSSSALLLLSYKYLAEMQSKDRQQLEQAAANFRNATTLIDKHEKDASQQYSADSSLSGPGSSSFAALKGQLEQQQRAAQQYYDGHKASLALDDVAWEDNTVAAWEPLYQANPRYPEGGPAELNISLRLADTYQSKAIYLCQVKGDYTGALSAVKRALEISKKNKLGDNKDKLLLNLFNSINLTQCQLSGS